jgi:hypothetical protein
VYFGTAKRPGAPNLINTYYVDDDAYGYCAPYITNGYLTGTDIMGNSYSSTSGTTWGPAFSTAQQYQSTATHELGHSIGLPHSGVSPAIMNVSRDRNQVFTPKQDDFNGVNFMYN